MIHRIEGFLKIQKYYGVPVAFDLLNLDKRKRNLERLVGMSSKLVISDKGLFK